MSLDKGSVNGSKPECNESDDGGGGGGGGGGAGSGTILQSALLSLEKNTATRRTKGHSHETFTTILYITLVT